MIHLRINLKKRPSQKGGLFLFIVVACQIGYKDVAHFSKFYGEGNGFPPSATRK